VIYGGFIGSILQVEFHLFVSGLITFLFYLYATFLSGRNIPRKCCKKIPQKISGKCLKFHRDIMSEKIQRNFIEKYVIFSGVFRQQIPTKNPKEFTTKSDGN